MNNSFPYEVEIDGVLRKNFSSAHEVLAWWESVGEKQYRYVATSYYATSSKQGVVFLDRGDWMFSNDKSALVKAAVQWSRLASKIVWRDYDPAHPIMGLREDAVWLEQPDGWWELEGKPFGLTNFELIGSTFYIEEPGSRLLERSLTNREVEELLIEGIFVTSGMVEDDDGDLQATYDIEFVDCQKGSIIAIIQDDLVKEATNSS